MTKSLKPRIWLVCVPLLAACGGNSITNPDGADSTVTSQVITDRTGRDWDITHAVNTYGMLPGNWKFGLGPDAITPAINPRMLSPGEPGYPGDADQFSVVGVEINGDARAYPVGLLATHEVANDTVGGVAVAALC